MKDIRNEDMDLLQELMDFAKERGYTYDEGTLQRAVLFVLTAIKEIDDPQSEDILCGNFSVMYYGARQEHSYYNILWVKYIRIPYERKDYYSNKMLMNPLKWDYRFYCGLIAEYALQNDNYKRIFKEFYQE